jgi:hypothetical protein
MKTNQVVIVHDNTKLHTRLCQWRQLQQWGNCYPSSSLHFRFVTSKPPSFWLPEGRRFMEDGELKQSICEVLRHFSSGFYTTCIERLTQRPKKCIDNGGDFVVK